jgi:hypothetical protein
LSKIVIVYGILVFVFWVEDMLSIENITPETRLNFSFRTAATISHGHITISRTVFMDAEVGDVLSDLMKLLSLSQTEHSNKNADKVKL